MAVVTNLLVSVDASEFKDFSVFLVSNIWMIVTAGDGEKLGPEASEKMWREFHDFCSNTDHSIKWHNFLSSIIGINEQGKHIHIIYQQLLQSVLEFLLKDRHSCDRPEEAIIMNSNKFQKQ